MIGCYDFLLAYSDVPGSHPVRNNAYQMAGPMKLKQMPKDEKNGIAFVVALHFAKLSHSKIPNAPVSRTTAGIAMPNTYSKRNQNTDDSALTTPFGFTSSFPAGVLLLMRGVSRCHNAQLEPRAKRATICESSAHRARCSKLLLGGMWEIQLPLNEFWNIARINSRLLTLNIGADF
jgi:hypothetical protein